MSACKRPGGAAPVLWLKENGKWRIAAYDVDVP
jgi:hypothetical protein